MNANKINGNPKVHSASYNKYMKLMMSAMIHGEKNNNAKNFVGNNMPNK